MEDDPSEDANAFAWNFQSSAPPPFLISDEWKEARGLDLDMGYTSIVREHPENRPKAPNPILQSGWRNGSLVSDYVGPTQSNAVPDDVVQFLAPSNALESLSSWDIVSPIPKSFSQSSFSFAGLGGVSASPMPPAPQPVPTYHGQPTMSWIPHWHGAYNSGPGPHHQLPHGRTSGRPTWHPKIAFCPITECPSSVTGFTSKSALNRHLHDKHTDGVVHQCDFCGEVFADRTSLPRHRKNCLG